jgi:predicted O-linked N-acetylglucosamine transferase (SPINDLY family)
MSQAFDCLCQQDYPAAETLYYQLALENPEEKQYQWYLGLVLLLQHKEAEAQMAWMMAMAEGDEAQVECWSGELVGLLDREAQRLEDQEEWSQVWLIRRYVREIAPDEGGNLLKLVELALALGHLEEDWQAWELAEALAPVDLTTLMPVVTQALQVALTPDLPLALAEACLAHITEPRQQAWLLHQLMGAAIAAAYSAHRFDQAIAYGQFCLQVNPRQPEVLSHLSSFYYELGDLSQAMAIGQQLYDYAETLPTQIHGNFLILRSLLRSGGQWSEALPYVQRQKDLLQALISEPHQTLDRATVSQLANCTFFLPYVADLPQENRLWHNQTMALCQASIQHYGAHQVRQFGDRSTPENPSGLKGHSKLRIGYLSHCLRGHSVGWLARWLYEYHDREQFEIHSYFVTYRAGVHDGLQEWYVHQSDYPHKMGQDGIAIAEQIHQDNIDILIDLDSITADITCEVVALKPAPIQATWLGWDASGIPAIDYYIADPYVLPPSAPDYYSEAIWRLPHSYLAVDGFEIGTPTLKRKDYEIPEGAIVYFSSQSGYKRHPDNVRLQMRILRGVPNSYFLIKDITQNTDKAQEFFSQIAEEEGVNPDRLYFLPKVASEMIHRANLGVADVVLDTYPYNGATTTLETLWLGIPVVTLVGQQFSARNSYTFMVNAGITEGIAWTPDEYVEWGIRFGQDSQLRQEVSWKLRQSRQTQPLWDGKRFTKDMEQAYQQMWLRK